MKYRLTSAAEEEYAESALFYLEESPQAALDFIEIIDAAIEEIAEFPARYPIYDEEVRVKNLLKFPFSIFYRIERDHVRILSIYHASRKEDQWENRL
ncbi:MAG TPA: type II toxin-antitoxin system RelE/ParE family toxin [Candidatus Kapabacteria bacterium]|nr:type II toxin-antitoxin system RelE/ParE family toxin [Candidatus Kapabacteria bacterium]